MLLGEREGNVVERETGRVIGQHKGYWFHTVGQRKGLGLGGGPWFVTDKDIEKNIVYVSHTDACHGLYGNEFHLTGFHFITADPWKGANEVDVLFKIRHTERPRPGHMVRQADGRFLIALSPSFFLFIHFIAAHFFIPPVLLLSKRPYHCTASGNIPLISSKTPFWYNLPRLFSL